MRYFETIKGYEVEYFRIRDLFGFKIDGQICSTIAEPPEVVKQTAQRFIASKQKINEKITSLCKEHKETKKVLDHFKRKNFTP